MSYKMSFLVGSIVDLVDEECENKDTLLLLQQELRYGVNTKTAVSICEIVFNDRFLANEIAKIIGNNEVSSNSIISFMSEKKDVITTLLKKYPSYFEDTIKKLLG